MQGRRYKKKGRPGFRRNGLGNSETGAGASGGRRLSAAARTGNIPTVFEI
jgi:hypothetical protein